MGGRMYHAGARDLQDEFDSRRLADRLEQVTVEETISEYHRKFIERSGFFFLATADADGMPQCSHKGGDPGFVRVLDERTLAFPDYDGNGMYLSLGNMLVNPKVGLLFIDMERPKRLRISGTAKLLRDDDMLGEYPGAKLIVRVDVERVFPNCPRYIHAQERREYSVYSPREDYTPPEPEWKQRTEFEGVLPKSPQRR